MPLFIKPLDWMDNGLCLEIGWEMFFPPDDSPVKRELYKEAKKICAKCEVIAECKEYGKDEDTGVWGGTTPKDRRDTRRREHRFKKTKHKKITIIKTKKRGDIELDFPDE